MKTLSRLSLHTIADYTNTFRKFQTFLGDDPPIAAITADQVRVFFASLGHLGKRSLLIYPPSSSVSRCLSAGLEM